MVQRAETVRVGGARIGVSGEELLDNLVVRLARRPRERCSPLLVLGVQVGARLEE